MDLNVIILAAGRGTRMQSKLPKVAHTLAGKPILSHILSSCEALGAKQLQVVSGYAQEKLKSIINPLHQVVWVEQSEQLGTSHAVQQALPNICEGDTVLVLTGDVPLISRNTLSLLASSCAQGNFGIVTVDMGDPTGYGRIQRDTNGDIAEIVEHKDASEAQLLIKEVNTGLMAIPGKFLREALPKIDNNNAQGEYYLTDIIALAVDAGLNVEAIQPLNAFEVEGINSRKQLAQLERTYQQHLANQYLGQGLSISDPMRIDFRGPCVFGDDVHIEPNVIFEGDNSIADGCYIGANSILKNVVLGRNVRIEAMSHLENAVVGDNAVIGPFARLRPGSDVGAKGKVGNFVEMKKARLGEGSKINHLSYVGDAELGKNVNIGAGTITCNYDGVNKHLTTIEDDVFVGSNTSLVAPVTLAKGGNIGAGSTITKNTPAHKLSLARAKQLVLEKWQRPIKKK